MLAGQAEITGEVIATGDGTTKDFAVTLKGAPVRPHKGVKVYLASDASVKAIDDGEGNLYGNGVSGTINYQTGAVTLHFEKAPAKGDNILADYEREVDAEDTHELPTIMTEYASMPVTSRTYALRTTMSLLKQFALQKRFGLSAEEMVARDLTTEMVSLSALVVIKKAYASAQGNVVFDVTPANGESTIERKLAFITTAIPQAQANIMDNAGRLTGINVLVAGAGASAYLMGLPGFKEVGYAFSATGTMLIGTLNGMPVLRSTVIPSNEILVVSKGQEVFEAGIVKAEWMPMFLTETYGGTDHNPLKSQKSIATSFGVVSPIPGMITKITLQNL